MPTPPAQSIAPIVFTLFDAVGLIMNVVSLVLSVVAIWLAFAFKYQADRVNDRTVDLLVEIRTDAKSIAGGVMHELHETGAWWRGTMGGHQVTGPLSTAPASPATGMSSAQVGAAGPGQGIQAPNITL